MGPQVAWELFSNTLELFFLLESILNNNYGRAKCAVQWA